MSAEQQATSCDYCRAPIAYGQLYYCSVGGFCSSFSCVKCFERQRFIGNDERRDFRRTIADRSTDSFEQFFNLSSRDREALQIGLKQLDEEDAVMDPDEPCRRKRD